jgi:hypothetical protein
LILLCVMNHTCTENFCVFVAVQYVDALCAVLLFFADRFLDRYVHAVQLFTVPCSVPSFN